MKTIRTLTFIASTLLAIAPVAVLAAPMREGNNASILQESETPTLTLIRVAGELKLDQNRLSLIDPRTGRRYTLSGENGMRQAMRLFQAGTRKVAVVGTMNGDAIEIRQIAKK